MAHHDNNPRIRPPIFAWFAATVVALILATPTVAHAIPAFARRTGMSCTACHDSWPRLNDFGELYRDNGYQLPGRQDTDGASPDYFPISARPALLYQYVQTTNQPADNGPVNVGSGSIQFPSADLLMGGPIADNISALLVVSGFGSDGTAPIESAWLRLSNIFGTSWLNVRAGKIELDLPASEHRTLTLTQNYLIYHYNPAGGVNTFQLGENQLGIELMGHTQGVGFRYAIDVVSANDNPGSNDLWSSPTVYAHMTETWHPFNFGLTRIRVGAFGSVGWYPTTLATLTPMGGTPAPIAGTGTNSKPFMQAGGEVGLSFGPLVHPLTLQVVGMYGRQDQGLVTGATRNVDYMGGFAELSYVPILRFTVFGRYDMVRSLTNGDPTQPNNIGDLDGFAMGGRFALLQTSFAAVLAHVEASWLVTQGAGANGLATQQMVLAAGFDVAL